jgi:RNA polymerase primary sigma factor
MTDLQAIEMVHPNESAKAPVEIETPDPVALSLAAPVEVPADLSIDPAVKKLIEYAKTKKTLSYEELSDYLPEHIANTDKIDQVLALLEKNNVQLIEEEGSGDEDRGPETRKTQQT